MIVRIDVHKLKIDADVTIGDRPWGLESPEGYEVMLSESWMKSHLALADLDLHLSIIVFLHEVGIYEWVRSMTYDSFWEYLKSFLE